MCVAHTSPSRNEPSAMRLQHGNGGTSALTRALRILTGCTHAHGATPVVDSSVARVRAHTFMTTCIRTLAGNERRGDGHGVRVRADPRGGRSASPPSS